MTRNTTSEGRVELLEVIDLENNQEENVSHHTPTTFMFKKRREFLLLRWLLRGLSLWYPKSSSCLSRFFYPGLTGLFLACNIICYILIGALKEDVDVTYNISAAIVSTGGFFNHLAASFYFRSRDFKDNMMNISLNGSQLKKFRKSLKYFNARIVISIAVFIHFIHGFFVAAANDSRALTTFLVDNVHPYHDAYRQGLLCLITATHVYMLGMYLAILWIVDLFQVMCNVRLQDQHWKFTSWTSGAEAAICDHICNYMSKVETSCHRLKWWFLVQNIVLIIFVPKHSEFNLYSSHGSSATC